MLAHAKKKDTLVVSLEGELDHCSAQDVRDELDALIADPHIRHLVLDMGALTFMDSSGIGVLLGRYRTLSQREGTVKVRNMNRAVTKIFMMSGLGQIIQSI